MIEDWVNSELLTRGIDTVDKLNIRDLSEAFGIEVYYWDMKACYIDGAIVVDAKKEPVMQYEEFLHELAHVIVMGDVKTITNFFHWKHLECKVNYIVPYIAMPKFAIDDFNSWNATEASEYFGITYKMAIIRLLRKRNKFLVRCS